MSIKVSYIGTGKVRTKDIEPQNSALALNDPQDEDIDTYRENLNSPKRQEQPFTKAYKSRESPRTPRLNKNMMKKA